MKLKAITDKAVLQPTVEAWAPGRGYDVAVMKTQQVPCNLRVSLVL